MIFGGIQKTSLIDFPGTIACVLFTPGCNFTCPYCHNGALAENRMDLLSPLPEEEALQFLESRGGFLEGVVITGGEPTLHGDLGDFCEKVKGLGYRIKLDTNGSNPAMLRDLFSRGLVDYVAMDVKTDPGGYAPHLCSWNVAGALTESIQRIRSSGLPHEFRTTCLAPFVTEGVVTRIATLLSGADLYILQKFKRGDVLDPAYIDHHAAPASDEEMARFQTIAAPYVKRCTVR